MPSLYPEILFHFTTRAGLFGILQDAFTVSYARERIVGNRRSTGFAVPMVSFCDLKLSELKDHMDKYGKYGIGMSKAWANEKGLNPVFYVNKHCDFASNFISAVGRLHKQLDSIENIDEHKSASRAYMDVLNTYRYIKNYEGDLKRREGKTTKNFRFADEREWRYVPPVDATPFSFVPLSKIETDADKAALNHRVAHLQLHFVPEDIRYLIVERDEERLDLIHHLEGVKRAFDLDTRRRLASRILTAEQIHNDI
jgi:Putative abortive phage resistance protein AbiGi, antitoxin